ncbi:P-type conjugative transfer protein TrbL [Sphingopyxis sp. OAS728]|nr:P-type conjugative transfer protein TrbL [Sphingopyxis sp. OAS728]
MNDTGVIDNFLSVFSTYIDSGFGLVGGEVGFLSSTLIVIDVTIAALFWAWGTDEDVLQRLVKKTLYIGVFAFIIGNFQTLATILLESFAGLGLKRAAGRWRSGISCAPAWSPRRASTPRSRCSTRRPILWAPSGCSPTLFRS